MHAGVQAVLDAETVKNRGEEKVEIGHARRHHPAGDRPRRMPGASPAAPCAEQGPTRQVSGREHPYRLPRAFHERLPEDGSQIHRKELQ